MFRLASVCIKLSGGVRDRVFRLFLAGLFLRNPAWRTDLTEVLASRSWIRVCVRVKVIPVRLFFDWSVLDLSHLLTVRRGMSLFNFDRRGVLLMTLLFYTHAFVHHLSALTLLSSLLRWLGILPSVSDTRLEVSKFIGCFHFSLFPGLVVRHLREVFPAWWMHWRPKLFVLVVPLSTGYFFHIRALWSSLVDGPLLNHYFVISVRLLAFTVLMYLYLRLISITHLAHSLVALVIVRVVILR